MRASFVHLLIVSLFAFEQKYCWVITGWMSPLQRRVERGGQLFGINAHLLPRIWYSMGEDSTTVVNVTVFLSSLC